MRHSIVVAILFSCLLNMNLHAQTSSVLPRYNYSKEPAAAYSPLTSDAVAFSLPDDWDEEQSDAVDIAFPFYYQNVVVGSVKATGNGSLMLNGAVNPDADLGNITGLSMDYSSKGRGNVLYELSGSAPNRIFKVEYRNVGLFDDTLSVDSLNFQIWLYEGSNAIEYRAGYANVPDADFAQNTHDFFVEQRKVLHMGLFQNRGNILSENPDSIYFHCVKNDGIDSVIYFPDMMASGSENSFVEGSYKKFPVEGSVFRFTPKDGPTHIIERTTLLNRIYPNPSTGKFTVSLKQSSKSEYKIYDVTGACRKVGDSTGNVFAIDMSSMAKGLYVLTISVNGHTESFKLIYE